MELGKEGPEPKVPAVAAAYRNAELVIDRKSGKIVGTPPVSFRGASQYSVWHPGDGGASFKAVYTSGEPPHVLYLLTLQILESGQGAVKPFLLTEVGDIVNMYFGTCTHLN
jgi:hypothetical protein